MKAVAGLASFAALAAAATATTPGNKDEPRGERAYQKCYSCHALEPGQGTLDGPTLYGVVGRRVAAEAGFDYSPALRRFAAEHKRWTPDRLDRFIADPEALVPGTSMNFHGISDAEERRALILYLERAGGRSR